MARECAKIAVPLSEQNGQSLKFQGLSARSR